ncbi:uncharacterized protein TNCV_3816331 [Trichonephila clavipes]|nr:uncharacterized protein TNCV_3816331 [Trichonephila clavipes]
MEESENDVGSLEQLLLYEDEHYLTGKLPLGDNSGKVLYGVEEYHQRNVGSLRVPPHPYTVIICPQNKLGFITKHILLQSVTFHIDLAWHYCRRSFRFSGVKESARKGHLDLRFASARCLEIVCGTFATPTSARIVERVTGGPQVLAARSFDPLSSWPSWSLQTRFSARGYLLVSTAPNNF